MENFSLINRGLSRFFAASSSFSPLFEISCSIVNANEINRHRFTYSRHICNSTNHLCNFQRESNKYKTLAIIVLFPSIKELIDHIVWIVWMKFHFFFLWKFLSFRYFENFRFFWKIFIRNFIEKSWKKKIFHNHRSIAFRLSFNRYH